VYEYAISHGSPAIMYDGDEATIFDIKSPVEIKIRLIRAVADPITRFFMKMVGGKHGKAATLIEIYQLKKENEEQVRILMSKLIERLPGDPWDLAGHPMFDRAPLLRIRVKRQWMRWL